MNQYIYQDPGISRLEDFSTKHELARNFYDDDEFCPIPAEKLPQVAEHRERIRFRTSPRSSPSSSPTRSNAYHQGSPLRQSPRTRAVPIVDPSKRTTVNVTQVTSNSNSNPLQYSVPVQQQEPSAPTTPSWPSTRRYGIPIVDPNSGQMIIPNGASYPYPQQHPHQSGYYVSVR
ncbi:hypothetical protein BGW37DRAFT_475235 [Umbelopsis sp. PMI_123]|nr:hypothetical protein BGW37DRAFT_475235 [Umbelopsis sp. PMI_123]